jgi:hypothetical protein
MLSRPARGIALSTQLLLELLIDLVAAGSTEHGARFSTST